MTYNKAANDRYRQNNRAKMAAATARWAAKDPARYEAMRRKWTRKYRAVAANREKEAARLATRTALRRGTLTRGPCESDEGDCEGRIEGHHDDYSKPLDVRWLCSKHHGKEHR